MSRAITPTIRPKQSIPSGMLSTSGRFLDFELQGSGVDIANRIYLGLAITNTSGANAFTLVPLSSMVDRVEIWINNKEVYRVPGVAFYVLTNYFNSSEAVGRLCDVAQYSDTTFLASQSVAALGSFTYRFPIDTIVNLAGIPISHPNIQITYRVVFNGGAAIYQAGAGSIADVSVSDAFLLIHGQQYSDSGRQQLHSILQSGTQVYKGFDLSGYQNLPTFNAVAATESTQLLTAEGKYDAVFLGLSTTGGTGTAMYSPLQLNSLDILDASAQSVVRAAGVGLSDTDIRKLISPQVFPGIFSDVIYWYFLNFNDAVVSDYNNSHHSDSDYTFKNNEKVRAYPTATTANVNFFFFGLRKMEVYVNFATGSWKINKM